MKKSVLSLLRSAPSVFPSSLWPEGVMRGKPTGLDGEGCEGVANFEVLEPRVLLSGTPYNSQPFTIVGGTQIEVEEFDLGGEGFGYSDTDTSNNGGAFRAGEGVDIQATTDAGGGYNVGWIADGEWLDYSVDTAGGLFDVTARVASQNSDPGDLRLLAVEQFTPGGQLVYTQIGYFNVNSTGGWQTWSDVTANNVALTSDTVALRLEAVGGGFNFNWIRFGEAMQSGTTSAVQSGNWSSASTWSNGVPDANTRAIVSQGQTVTLDSSATAKEIVVHGTLDVAEVAGQTIELTTRWMHVNSGGVFQVGSAANRYDQGDFVLTLTGTDQNADFTVETATGTMQITDNDGFLMAAGGGRLQFFGQEKISFTKLGVTAEAGAGSIIVENVIERNFDGTTTAASDGQLDWEVGDEIVIASSTRDYDDQEVRTITGITDLGNGTTRLTLNANLAQRHYGEIETYDNGTREIDLRAEVALLNRNVRVQGLASQDTDSNWGNRALFNSGSTGDNRGISGHIMIMPTAGQISVEGVQLDRLGQTGTLGRYPIHWHLAGDRTGDVLKGVSVTNSNNRGVTVHGTHNLQIQDVVLHDIHGHGFFME
ncbi:carbohydrate-binding protein, partial [Algisphaera agarilytica]|uniref:carbohydrate-binding protein n=1 Tax=Algisphaera agarilytica TaxID=1385975 RepID=UPI001C884F17